LRVKASGDVTWLVTVPSGQGAVRRAALGEGEPDGAGWLSDSAANEPLVLRRRGDPDFRRRLAGAAGRRNDLG